jgi:hypothetical protein
MWVPSGFLFPTFQEYEWDDGIDHEITRFIAILLERDSLWDSSQQECCPPISQKMLSSPWDGILYSTRNAESRIQLKAQD